MTFGCPDELLLSQLLVDADAGKITGTTASYEKHLEKVVVDHVLE